MKRLTTAVLLWIAAAVAAIAGCETIAVRLPVGIDAPRESHFRDALAAALRARGDTVRTEVILKGGRADIVTQTYAIEVDKAHKWHESVGQALHYAMQLRLKPAIALIGADTLTPDQLDALKALCERHGIEVIFISTLNTNSPVGRK